MMSDLLYTHFMPDRGILLRVFSKRDVAVVHSDGTARRATETEIEDMCVERLSLKTWESAR